MNRIKMIWLNYTIELELGDYTYQIRSISSESNDIWQLIDDMQDSSRYSRHPIFNAIEQFVNKYKGDK